MVTTRPTAKTYIIKRPRLTKILDESEARIILLCAPAGYGKTTLAREWTESQAGRVSWYLGGSEMLDSAALALQLVEALRLIGLSDQAAASITRLVSENTPAEAVGRALGKALAPEMSPVLAIDDYHHAARSPESETLVGSFVAHAPIRLIVTSRVRPSWLTARMSVYGDALVVGTDELAFTPDEATAVMSRKDSFSAELVEQARGWPAVIGLAALGRCGVNVRTEGLLPADLYEYFAQDLFKSAPSLLRRTLFILALGGDRNPNVLKSLVGEALESDLIAAVNYGFASKTPQGLEVHPLLQSFLLAKLRETDREFVRSLMVETTRGLAEVCAWDECLSALIEFPDSKLIVDTLRDALPELLTSGRLATVNRWLTLARESATDDPVLLIAEAELALRNGDGAHAQSVAEHAGDLIGKGDTAAQAYVIATRAAHLRGDELGAQRNLGQARSLSNTRRTRADALWLEFLQAVEVLDPDVRLVLQRLEEVSDETAAHGLQLHNARMYLAMEIDGDFRRALKEVELAYGLLQHVPDPLIRTNFLNSASVAMLHLGQYERSLGISQELIDEGARHGIEFAVDHALVTRVGAFAGLRHITSANRTLSDLRSRAKTSSSFITVQSALKTARVRVAVGDLQIAETILRGPPPHDVPVASLTEWIATRAVVLAALGSIEEATEAISAVRSISGHVDGVNQADIAEAIISIRGTQASTAGAVIATLKRLFRSGDLDCIVLGCRVCPELARVGASDLELREELTRLLAASRDVDIGRAGGLPMPRELRPRSGLSSRERDVYELLVQGRTNREIAKRFFISESTTKVHVRHIYEKLGVHSRAEAASLMPGLELREESNR